VESEDEAEERLILIDPNLNNLHEILMTVTCCNKVKLVREVIETDFLNKMDKVVSECVDGKGEKSSSNTEEKAKAVQENTDGSQRENTKNKATFEFIFLIYKQLCNE
jgi:hypothetical protein